MGELTALPSWIREGKEKERVKKQKRRGKGRDMEGGLCCIAQDWMITDLIICNTFNEEQGCKPKIFYTTTTVINKSKWNLLVVFHVLCILPVSRLLNDCFQLLVKSSLVTHLVACQLWHLLLKVSHCHLHHVHHPALCPHRLVLRLAVYTTLKKHA